MWSVCGRGLRATLGPTVPRVRTSTAAARLCSRVATATGREVPSHALGWTRRFSQVFQFGPDGQLMAADALGGPSATSRHFDLVVVGGGSGGLAAAREAAKLGKVVSVLDFVDPSPHGTVWGLGGTCVNVGCIPKKLMHQAALLGKGFSDAGAYGWSCADATHDWSTLVHMVRDYVRSSNFGYVAALLEEGVEYFNAKGRFVNATTVECTPSSGEPFTITADDVIVAVGTRPTYLDIPGAELCITSDDLFSLDHAPGKTLVVGGSYVALECAGFLTGLGTDTTVMARSVLLRGFDQQMANLVGVEMEREGTKILQGCTPVQVEQLPSGRFLVTWTNGTRVSNDEYDTVLLAVGRRASTHGLGLSSLGVELDRDGKIIGGSTHASSETSSVPTIHAVGDVLSGRPELTPVAVAAGRRLVQRLYTGSADFMCYDKIATTVFTPLEYACVGMTEEDALATMGDEAVEVFHLVHSPLEFAGAGRESECYCKLVCGRDTGQVLGVHILGPQAGEVMQGFAVAIQMGATKADIDRTIPIHPTHAEELIGMDRTKRSGRSPVKSSC